MKKVARRSTHIQLDGQKIITIKLLPGWRAASTSLHYVSGGSNHEARYHVKHAERCYCYRCDPRPENQPQGM